MYQLPLLNPHLAIDGMIGCGDIQFTMAGIVLHALAPEGIPWFPF